MSTDREIASPIVKTSCYFFFVIFLKIFNFQLMFLIKLIFIKLVTKIWNNLSQKFFFQKSDKTLINFLKLIKNSCTFSIHQTFFGHEFLTDTLTQQLSVVLDRISSFSSNIYLLLPFNRTRTRSTITIIKVHKKKCGDTE